MKRVLIMVLILGTLTLLSASAFAAGPVLKIRADGCGMYAADGSIFFGEFQAVVTQPAAGPIVNLTCRGQQPPGIPKPERAVHFNYRTTGELCHTPFGSTRNWSVVVTPSGKVTMRCQVNPGGFEPATP